MALITKLESAVTDESLLPLGALLLHSREVASVTSQKRWIGINGNVTMEIVGDGYFTDSSLTPTTTKKVSFTGAGEHGVYTSNGNYDIICTMKYDFTILALNGDGVFIDLDENKFMNNVYKIQMLSTATKGDIASFAGWPKLKEVLKGTAINTAFPYIGGDIKVFEDLPIEKIHLSKTGVVGDLASLSGKALLNTIAFTDCAGVYGDLSSLANNTAITSLNLIGCNKVTGEITDLANLVDLMFIAVQATQVTGTSDELAAALAAAGKTSGTVQIIDKNGTNKTYTFPLT